MSERLPYTLLRTAFSIITVPQTAVFYYSYTYKNGAQIKEERDGNSFLKNDKPWQMKKDGKQLAECTISQYEKFLSYSVHKFNINLMFQRESVAQVHNIGSY